MKLNGLDPIPFPAAMKPPVHRLTDADFDALRAELDRMRQRITELELELRMERMPLAVWPMWTLVTLE